MVPGCVEAPQAHSAVVTAGDERVVIIVIIIIIIIILRFSRVLRMSFECLEGECRVCACSFAPVAITLSSIWNRLIFMLIIIIY